MAPFLEGAEVFGLKPTDAAPPGTSARCARRHQYLGLPGPAHPGLQPFLWNRAHVFPDRPSSRYPETAPKVRSVLDKFGLNYWVRSLGP